MAAASVAVTKPAIVRVNGELFSCMERYLPIIPVMLLGGRWKAGTRGRKHSFTAQASYLLCQGSLALGFVQRTASPRDVTKPPRPAATQTGSGTVAVTKNFQINTPSTRLIHAQTTFVAGLELTLNGVI